MPDGTARDLARRVRSGRIAAAAVLAAAAAALSACSDVRPIRTPTLEPIPVARHAPSGVIALTSPILAQPAWESTGFELSGPSVDLFMSELSLCDGEGTEMILAEMPDKSFGWIDWGRAFTDALRPAGYDILDDRDGRFANDTRRDAVRFRVEPRIDAIDSLWCGQDEIGLFQPLKGTLPRGVGSIAVHWTVFDELTQRVVLETDSRGFAVLRQAYRFMVHPIIQNAFASAAANLGAQPAFHRVVTEQGLPSRMIEGPPPVRAVPGGDGRAAAPVPVVGAPPPRTAPLDSLGPLRASVAVVHLAGGHGSAFLISPDGLMLTNEHVVGAARQVRIEFEDGTARIGRVLDREPRRDVALVDIGPIDRAALPIRLDAARVGERVAAIGAGLRDDLPASVTEGIVSAYRESTWRVNRQTYIQSDADIIGGNSGGPLVDRRGNVVGIAVASFVTGLGEDTSLDLFIPIGEALDALGLVLPHGTPAPTPRPGEG